MRLVRKLLGIPVTVALLLVVVGVFILLETSGGSGDPSTLVRFGAKYGPRIERGEYWRFLSACFIHIGLVHLVLNSIALGSVGSFVEMAYGPGRFLGVFLVTGAASVAASHQHLPDAISGGASGALFGLAGLIIAGSRRFQRRSLYDLRIAARSILPMIVLILALGLLLPVLAFDNVGHLGGLAAGALLGLVVPPLGENSRRWSALQIVLVVLGTAAMGMAGRSVYKAGFEEKPAEALSAGLELFEHLMSYGVHGELPPEDARDRARTMRERIEKAIEKAASDERASTRLAELARAFEVQEEAFVALESGRQKEFERLIRKAETLYRTKVKGG